MRKIVLVGATSAMAQHCARLWAQHPTHFVLIGRNQEKTDRVAQDLLVRGGAHCRVDVQIQPDFDDTIAIGQTVTKACEGNLPDIVLIAHGDLPDQAACQQDLNRNRQAMVTNGLSPAWFAESFVNAMEPSGQGTIAVIGSVAGDRGRQSNYVYGAAKGLVARYVRGLQHRLAHTKINVLLVKPGPTATPMTAQLDMSPSKLAPVAQVAAEIVNAISKRRTILYTPGKWQLIMWVIRHLPNFIFNRLKI